MSAIYSAMNSIQNWMPTPLKYALGICAVSAAASLFAIVVNKLFARSAPSTALEQSSVNPHKSNEALESERELFRKIVLNWEVDLIPAALKSMSNNVLLSLHSYGKPADEFAKFVSRKDGKQEEVAKLVRQEMDNRQSFFK